MPEPVDTSTLVQVSAALGDLSHCLSDIEEELLSCLVVMGEPAAQRAVDGWVDQVVDLLRAVDDVATAHRVTLARVSSRQAADHLPAQHPSTEPAPRDGWGRA